MNNTSNFPRYILGALAIAIGFAITFFMLATMGFFTRVGVVSGSARLFGYLIIASMAHQPVIVGIHTIFYRQRQDPNINDKALRGTAMVAFVGIGTLIYTAVMNRTSPEFGSLVALMVISGICQAILRRTPGGIIDPAV